MDIGAAAGWAQVQGPIVKAALVTLILIVAGVAIALVLKKPETIKPASPINSQAVVNGKVETHRANEHAKQILNDRGNPQAPEKVRGHQVINVQAVNQSGGVTAGEIDNLNLGSDTKQ